MSESNEKIRVLVVDPMEHPYEKMIDQSLEELQAWVDGYIEVIYPFEDSVGIICNEEAKLDGLPLNRGLYTDDGQMYDIICGRFLVVGLSEDSFCSLTEDLSKKYQEIYDRPEVFIRVGDRLKAFDMYNARLAVRLANKLNDLYYDTGFLDTEAIKAGKTHTSGMGALYEDREMRDLGALLSGEDLQILKDLSEIEELYPEYSKEVASLRNQIEEFFVACRMDRVMVYQIDDSNEENQVFMFQSFERNKASGFEIRESNYQCVYRGMMKPDETLDDIFKRLNLNRPESYEGHSLSVSDILVIKEATEEHVYYVDSFGFRELRDFQDKNPLKNAEEMLEDDYEMIDGIINNGKHDISIEL